MFEYLAEAKTDRPVIVYWGLREPSACYELEKTAATIGQISGTITGPVSNITQFKLYLGASE